MNNFTVQTQEVMLKRGKRNYWKRGKTGKVGQTKYPGQTNRNWKQLGDYKCRHFSVAGKLVKPRLFVDYYCGCLMKCWEKVSSDERDSLFKEFWNLGSYDSQTGFIAATVQEQSIKRKRNKGSSMRK